MPIFNTEYKSYKEITPRKPDANTVLWYKLNGNALDSSGNGHNGSFPNGQPTWDMNAGEDGCWNGYHAVRLPSLGTFNVFTISLWIKGVGSRLYLTDYGYGDRNNLDVVIGDGGVGLAVYRGGWDRWTDWGGNFADGNWHNVIIVKNGSDYVGYKDGQKISTWSQGTSIIINSNSQIGYHPTSSSTSSGDQRIDNFIIQSNAWGDADALAYYDQTKNFYGIS